MKPVRVRAECGLIDCIALITKSCHSYDDILLSYAPRGCMTARQVSQS